LLKAVKRVAFRYLFGVLLNRVSKLLAKRALAVLVVLAVAALTKELLPIGSLIGWIIALGIGVWSIYDVQKTIREISKKFQRGWQRMFNRLPQQLLDDFLLDCLNRKPECCEFFQREVSKLLLAWVKSLKPGWKKNLGTGGVLREWRQLVQDIKQQISGPLRRCCSS
jgi:hypothetical protein